MASRRRRTVRTRRSRKRGRRRSWFSRLSIGGKILVCFCVLLLAATASIAVYAASKLGKINTEEIAKEDIIINQEVKESEPLGEGYTNVALFGVDSRERRLEDSTLSDCIIVASLNNETREIKMVSVYRDTLLDVGQGTMQKCNAAYSYGGPAQAINMLNTNLDLDIQKYVTVDFAIVSEVIDLLGGVEIDVQEEEVQYINEFIDETGAVAEKNVNYVYQGGLQLLDGVQATTYARIRSTAGGDFTRTERQRLVIEKMVEKVQSSDLATLNSIIDKVLPTIYTNFTAAEILNYAKDYTKYQFGENTGFPFDKTTDMLSGVGSVVIPTDLTSNVIKLHEFLYGITGYTPSAKVQDINYAVIVKAGDRSATDDSTLNSQKYEVAPEDVIQDNTGGVTDTGQGTGAGEGTGTVEPGTEGGQTPGTEGEGGENPTPPGTEGGTGTEGSPGTPGENGGAGVAP